MQFKKSVYEPKVSKNTMSFGLDLSGMESLIETLMHKLGPEAILSSAGKGLRAAAKPMVASAKNHAEKIKDTGLLSESIISRVKIYKTPRTKNGETVIAKLWVGADNKKVKGRKTGPGPFAKVVLQNPSRYAHLVEFGTKRSAAKPFMRPALAESKDEAQAILAKSFEAGLQKTVAKNKIKKGDA